MLDQLLTIEVISLGSSPGQLSYGTYKSTYGYLYGTYGNLVYGVSICSTRFFYPHIYRQSLISDGVIGFLLPDGSDIVQPTSCMVKRFVASANTDDAKHTTHT